MGKGYQLQEGSTGLFSVPMDGMTRPATSERGHFSHEASQEGVEIKSARIIDVAPTLFSQGIPFQRWKDSC
jgi:hypothetical protein